MWLIVATVWSVTLTYHSWDCFCLHAFPAMVGVGAWVMVENGTPTLQFFLSDFYSSNEATCPNNSGKLMWEREREGSRWGAEVGADAGA